MENKEVLQLTNYQLISINANHLGLESEHGVEIKTSVNNNIIDRSSESIKVAISQKVFFDPASYFRLEIEYHAGFALLDNSAEDTEIKDAIDAAIVPIVAQASLLTAIISDKFEGFPLIITPTNS